MRVQYYTESSDGRLKVLTSVGAVALITARGVRIRILMSSQGDHDVAYCRSSRTISSNLTRLRPLTCHSR